MSHLIPVIDLQHLDIVPSYSCSSADCVGCYQKADSDYSNNCGDTLDLALLTPFLRRYISTIRVNSFGLFGGEFTEYDRCCELVSLLTSNFPGIQIEIVSNGQDHRMIAALIEAGGSRSNLVVEISIDGYGEICDKLRGKEGYFAEAIRSIEEMATRKLARNVRINSRYFPEHETALTELGDFLYREYGIARSAFSLIDVTFRGAKHPDARSYITALRKFARFFWRDSYWHDLPRSHPLHSPYDSTRKTCFSTPGIHPDGYLYTCFDYNCGVRVGRISDDDVVGMVTKMLRLSTIDPGQCDRCPVGQCVLHHYELEPAAGPTERLYLE